MRRLLFALPLLGCRGDPMAQAWQLDRPRVLAIRGEPAEPRPGQTVQFEALYYLPPNQELQLATWFACLPEQASSYGCAIDPSISERLTGLDPSTLSPEELQALQEELLAAGLIGVEPWLPPSWTVPEDALDELDEDERLEGVSAVVTVTAIPEGAAAAEDLELVFKRIPVSEAGTPNENPRIEAFLVDGVRVEDGGVVPLGFGAAPVIEPVLAEDAVQTYLYRNDSGEDEEREEQPYIQWYAEDGSFDQPYALYPQMDVVWTAPARRVAGLGWPLALEAPRRVRLIGVLRDRRGGMGWGSLEFELAGDEAAAAD